MPDMITAYGIGDYPAAAGFGPVDQRHHQLVWMLHGSAVIYDDDAVYHLEPGGVFLARPGRVVRYRWDTRGRTRHGYVHFHLRRGYRCPVSPAAWPAVRQATVDGLLIATLNQILAWDGSRPGPAAAVALSALRHAFLLFVTGADERAPLVAEVDDPVVARVLAALRRAWHLGPATAMPVSELCAIAGVSRAQLHRVFKAEFGQGPAAVLRALRLVRAADLLRRTDCDLATVAADTGFADPFHLSHAFKRLFGLAPRAWRAEPDRRPDLPWERTYRRWAARVWSQASHDNLRPE